MPRQRISLANGTSKGLVLDLIRSQGPISRVELAEATGLTQATMSTVVRQLIDTELVVETGRGESTGGRTPVLIDINPSSRFAIGLQLGSESNTYVVVNLLGAIVGRMRTTGVGSTDPATMVEVMAQEINLMLAQLGIDKRRTLGVGIVAPGPLDLARGVILAPPHLTAWNDVPIRAMLSSAVGLPVLLDNDATAAAIGDFWVGDLGASVSHATVYMGAGIGSGVLIEGTIFRGASSNTGELSQVIVAARGDVPQDLESVAAPRAVVQEALRRADSPQRLGLLGVDEFEDFKSIARAATHSDELALALITESAEHLATAVVSLANLFDLDSVSLAGPAFAIAGSLYVRIIAERLEREFFARAHHGIRVRLSTHVSDAAAVGGAALVLQTILAPRTMGLGTGPTLL
ncbi:MAG: ROK family transcriptional regulator [Acidobacteria bacterium]|nr:ROK family transcriptional regulator [Acidobacteriota bacterium]